MSWSESTRKWLQIMQLEADRTLKATTELLAGTPTEPPTEPPVDPPVEPPGGGGPTEPPQQSEDGVDYPQNEAQVRDALQTYAREQRVGIWDSRTRVDISSTIEIAQPPSSGYPWGVDGSYGKLLWKGGKADLLRFVGTQGVHGRGLTVKNLVLDGNDINMNGSGATACLRVSAPLGDNGSIYKFNLENIFTATGDYGVILEGGVYEGHLTNVHAENMVKDGIFMRHMNLGAPGQGVVSNILLIHPNSSRNYGAGIRCVYSVYILGGSFIVNGDGGVQAADGLRGMMMSNGENTAGKEGAAFVLGNNGYGSVINLCEGSSDGNTRCRRWDGTQWIDVGSPMLYLMQIPGGVQQNFNHTSYYGAPPDPMRVVK